MPSRTEMQLVNKGRIKGLRMSFFRPFFVSTVLFSATALGPAYGLVVGPGASGGGGITNPQPADPQTIELIGHQTIGKALIPWFRAREEWYRKSSEADQLKSPFRKIFESSQSIFSLIRDSKVEFRYSGPCLDANGAPQDGSIYAKPGSSICLSPVTMAPKLNYGNVLGETLALAAHEYSHLFGTTEAEAIAIQSWAVSDLSDLEEPRLGGDIARLNLKLESHDVNGPRYVASPFYFWREFINSRLESLDQTDLAEIDERLRDILEGLGSTNLRLLFVPYKLADLKELHSSSFRVAKLALCEMDSSIRLDRRELCRRELDRAFGGKSFETFREFALALTTNNRCMNAPDSCFSAPIYNQIIRRPKTVDEVRVQFGIVDNYLKEMRPYLRDLSYCGWLTDEKNCSGAPETWTPPTEKNYKVTGEYNKSGSQAICTGAWAWPHLYQTSCQLEGHGVKPDFDGTYHFEVLGIGETFPWICGGKNLEDLHCIQQI